MRDAVVSILTPLSVRNVQTGLKQQILIVLGFLRA